MHNPSMWKFKNKEFIRLLKLYLRKEIINHIIYSMKENFINIKIKRLANRTLGTVSTV